MAIPNNWDCAKSGNIIIYEYCESCKLLRPLQSLKYKQGIILEKKKKSIENEENLYSPRCRFLGNNYDGSDARRKEVCWCLNDASV